VTSHFARWTRRHTAAAALVVGIGLSLSACGNSGTTLAQQACAHINRSIALLKKSEHHSNPSEAAKLQLEAYNQLRDALPITAEAAYDDGQWQALMTTVSESNRVPETLLVGALQQQCTAADSTVFGQQGAPPPDSLPPGPSGSSSTSSP
jgi:hypothetical protein